MFSLIIDDHIPFIKGVLEPFANIIYVKGGIIDRNIVRQADGLIIRTRTLCDAGLLEGTPVKFIATATIGFDHIDTEYCKRNEINWFHAPGCNSNSVKQYIASTLANLYINQHIKFSGKKIGIIGVGHVGSKVAQLAEALGMIPLLNDPPRERVEKSGPFVSLEEVQETSDFITFHVPLIAGGLDRTLRMADKAFFERLSKKPIVINSSRGAVVDTESVKNALITGKISGFAADVWEYEPGLDLELMAMSAVATPHIAGYSVEGKANGTSACVNHASRFFGFGMENWYPPLLPPPVNQEIVINVAGKSKEQVIAEAILAGYNVLNDDKALRDDPSQFENLRNYYPIRREFEAFKLNIQNASPIVNNCLSKLGFSTTNC